MAGGFTAPGILFLSTWDKPERDFCKAVFSGLLQRGYTRFCEPCAGGFAMPLMALDAGWKPESMEASDVGLYSAIIGTTLDPNRSWDELAITLDGKPMDLGDGNKIDQAARALYLQLLTRFEVKPKYEYWLAIIEDLKRNEKEHTASIRERVLSMDQRLHGLRYQTIDLWEHMAKVQDDPHTVVSLNAPTFKNGFEQFFDTKGRLCWAEPTYEIYDPEPGGKRQLKEFADAPALLVTQQQLEPGNEDYAVHARHLSLGQYVYMKSNRPEEIFEITGGPKVSVSPGRMNESSIWPTLPYDYVISPKSAIDVLPCKATTAEYYKNFWLHRLQGKPNAYNLLILIDGMVAGVIGYSVDAMARPFPRGKPWTADFALLRFAVGPHHETYRLTRLATMIALQRRTAQMVLEGSASVHLEASAGLLTVEMTRHPEIKGLRGLMKLIDKWEHPDGFKLTYASPWDEGTHQECLQRWLAKEESWQKARAAGSTSAKVSLSSS